MQRTQFSLAVFAVVAALTLTGCGEQKKPGFVSFFFGYNY